MIGMGDGDGGGMLIMSMPPGEKLRGRGPEREQRLHVGLGLRLRLRLRLRLPRRVGLERRFGKVKGGLSRRGLRLRLRPLSCSTKKVGGVMNESGEGRRETSMGIGHMAKGSDKGDKRFLGHLWKSRNTGL
jgi:hypothetical protein